MKFCDFVLFWCASDGPGPYRNERNGCVINTAIVRVRNTMTMSDGCVRRTFTCKCEPGVYHLFWRISCDRLTTPLCSQWDRCNAGRCRWLRPRNGRISYSHARVASLHWPHTQTDITVISNNLLLGWSYRVRILLFLHHQPVGYLYNQPEFAVMKTAYLSFTWFYLISTIKKFLVNVKLCT